MTAKRKKPVRRRTRKKTKLPNWSLLVLGLVIGLMLAWVIQFTVKQANNPASGLSSVIKKANKALTKKKSQKPQKPVKTSSRPKTKFRFYDMLAANESLLPDTGAKVDDGSAYYKVVKNVAYTLQVAALANYADADKLRARLALSGLFAQIQKITLNGKGTFHRVRLGPYSTLAEMNATDTRLKKLGYKARRIKISLAAGT